MRSEAAGAVGMKIAVKDSMRGHIAAMRKRLKRESVRGEELMRRKAFDSTLFNRTHTPYMDGLGPCIELEKLAETAQNL